MDGHAVLVDDQLWPSHESGSHHQPPERNAETSDMPCEQNHDRALFEWHTRVFERRCEPRDDEGRAGEEWE